MIKPRNFRFWHKISAIAALVVSAFTYLTTIEPSASFWDCGEFIASSYKLEVGHPPGNPVFQLFARIFTLFGDNMHAAILVNALSAVCSAFTVFFLYLTIVWLVRRLVKAGPGGYTAGQTVAIIGSGLVGSLAYCFSDTFWFSAVEGEVYAMSSLFTAAVFWAMTMWYDRADNPHSNRWIVLIAFLMGLSIGIHLLNLLAIPALVYMYCFRKREDSRFSFWELVKIFLIGVVILALILFLIIPWLPKLAAYTDLLFVNVFGLPYNSGAAFFVLALLGLCFWGLFVSLRREKVFLNTALLCLTAIIIGFSVFSIDVIRSVAKTPTNEYQPDNAFTLVRYLSREQYGKNPLLYGQYYGARYEIGGSTYWAPLDGRYERVSGPAEAKYRSSDKMLFPRMWSGSPDGRNEKFYSYYAKPGRKPSMGENLAYFFDYQLGWMYWRYFMWNFAGRQNDIHSPEPGELFYGNWESGVGFIDRARLGDQSAAPASLAGNKGKNHYYFLPLILGLIGLFFQFGRDKRGSWLTFLMFFMTGIAIVIYLNQPPFQVRERDYAYAGSFYFFCVWIGLGVAAVCAYLKKIFPGGRGEAVAASLAAAACLGVPVLMAAENWDDHDRSNRRTAVEVARNYLNSAAPDGILVTHGDNDTFPLWYAQEVEGFRNDVRICNTSLLGTDWYIDQMKWASNNSSPLPLTVDKRQYLYGTNEYVPIHDVRKQEMSISDVMKLFRHPDVKLPLQSGRMVDYIASRKIVVPVNKANAIRSGIVPAKWADQVPDSIVLEIPEGRDVITKPELFLLDLLSNYQWDRQINFLSLAGDLQVGIKDYLLFDGYSYRLIPIRNHPTTTSNGIADTDDLYAKMTGSFSFDAVSRDDYFIDYQNLYTNMGTSSIRSYFVLTASAFIQEGEDQRALEALDKCMEVTRNFPLDGIPLGFSGVNYMALQIIGDYYRLGRPERAREIATEFSDQLLESVEFYYGFYDVAKDRFEMAVNYIYYVMDILRENGDGGIAGALDKKLKAIAQ